MIENENFALKEITEKGENDGNLHILLYLQCIPPFERQTKKGLTNIELVVYKCHNLPKT